MSRSKHWNLAVLHDIAATELLRQNNYKASHAEFTSAFQQYNLAWEGMPSPQLLFEFIGFCWCLLEPGIPKIITSRGLFQQCDQKCFDLIAIGQEHYKHHPKICFIKEYIDSRNGLNTTEERILKTINADDPADTPYFLLFLLSDKKRYLENVKLLWNKCDKERTIFNQLIISLIECDCVPNFCSQNASPIILNDVENTTLETERADNHE